MFVYTPIPTNISVVMDIHRCRFVPYPPAAINALAFSHPSPVNNKEHSPNDLRLALGRSNGDVEIWNPFGGQWFQETILRGAKDRSIENLAWTQDWDDEDGDEQNKKLGRLRLFSIGNSSSLTEWDLSLGTPARHANGNFGDLWCFAAQPGWVPGMNTPGEKGAKGTAITSQYLAAGCSDGTIILFSTEDNDLRFAKSLGKPPTKKPHVLSITWRDRNTVVAGYDDSVIRVYDIRTRTTERNMSLGKPGDGKSDIHIWAVRCLPDGGIVSGDSTGQLKIWDAANYSLVQSIQAHKADILDIAISKDGKRIFTGGADQRTVAYHLFGPQKGQKGQRWAEVMHRRYHQHDVRSLATYESKDFSMLVSGGLDTVPVIVPIQELHFQYHRSLSHLPQQPQICSSPETRLMLTWWDREISLWHVSKPGRANPDSGDAIPDPVNHHQLVAKLLLKGDENITSAHISGDGKLIVVATVAGVKLFQLRFPNTSGFLTCRTRQIELPIAIAKFGAKTVRFSPDGHWLSVVRLNNVLVLAKAMRSGLPKERPRYLEQIVKLTRSSREKGRKGSERGLDTYLDTICSLTYSQDSRILAVGDLSGRIDTWLLEGYEDLMPNADFASHANLKASRSSSDSDTSDDDSDEDDVTVMQGQKWVRNPAGANFPKLGCAVSFLSFRPQDMSRSPPLTNGNIGLHATRRTPHPYSHELPTDEAKLVAVTANNELTEFDVLKGGLTDWSRRNPAEYLPLTLKEIKDPAMGCFWIAKSGRQRLWLYGATWLFMLDMSRDLPGPQAVGKIGDYEVFSPTKTSGRKRKRSQLDLTTGAKRNTGAGDALHDSDADVGLAQSTLKSKDHYAKESQMSDMGGSADQNSETDDGLRAHDFALALLRRQKISNGSLTDADSNSSPHINGEMRKSEHDESQTTTGVDSEASPDLWHTFMYRSILGIVPLGLSLYVNDEGQARHVDVLDNMEVAIVERPMWELEFTPRFDGGQDWDA